MELDIKNLCKKYQLDFKRVEKSRIKKEDLRAIVEHHASRGDELTTTAESIVKMLRDIPEIHSMKLRIKDPEHLVVKILRKNLEKSEYRPTVETYTEEITDLVGIRALHLFKDDWMTIHDFLLKNWDQVEKPTAYVRQGDSSAIQEEFEGAGCSIEPHPFGYRSVHYLVKTRLTKSETIVELQVRTIFEEAWSEIDHRVRYPNQSEDPSLGEFLRIFNRYAGAADEMGTFVRQFKSHLDDRKCQIRELQAQAKRLKSELDDALNKYSGSEKEKEALQQKLKSYEETNRRFGELTLLSAEEPSELPSILQLGSAFARIFSSEGGRLEVLDQTLNDKEEDD